MIRGLILRLFLVSFLSALAGGIGVGFIADKNLRLALAGAVEAQGAPAVSKIPNYTSIKVNLRMIFTKGITVENGMKVSGDIEAEGSNLNLGGGSITAANIIYSLAAGSGISISGSRQNPTIGISNVGSIAVSSIANLKGDVDLVAGDNMTISKDGNKITIKSSYTDTDTKLTESEVEEYVFDGEDSALFSELDVGRGTFVVGTDGNLSKVKGVSYVWPSSQAGGSGYVLSNNGSGTLSWIDLVSTAVPDDSLDFDKFADSMTLDAITSVAMGGYDLRFTGTGGTSALTITSGGNVGIGTTAPTQGLHVVGSARITGALYDSTNSAGSNGLLLTSTGVGTTWSSVSGALGGSVFLNGGNAFGGRATLGTTDNNALDIYTNSSAKLTVLANGNVGIGTTSPEFKFTVDNDGGILASGTYGSGATLTSSGAGTRFIWYPRKAAIRAGVATSTEFNDASIGVYSVAMGYVPMASGNYATAFGNFTRASGAQSFAAGRANTASGGSSTALGDATVASGQSAFAANQSTTASGHYSTSFGDTTTAQSYNSAVFGRYNVVNGATTSWVSTDPLFVIGNGSDSSNRSNALTILKNGSVGIGTTSPSAKLHIVGDMRLTGALYDSTNSAGSNGLLLTSTGVGTTWSSISGALGGSVFLNGGNAFGGRATLGTTDNNALDVITNSTAKLTVLANGNVGIGTTSPGANLDIYQQSPSSDQILFNIRTSDDASRFVVDEDGDMALDGAISIVGNSNDKLYLMTYDVAYKPAVAFYPNGNSSWRIKVDGADGYKLKFATSHLAGTDKVVFDGNGNVGIGTVSPLVTLDVAGTSWLRGGTAASGGLYVNSSGNVGIGTTAPGTLLHLAGTSPELRIESASSTDDPTLYLKRNGSTTVGGKLYFDNDASDIFLENIQNDADADVVLKSRLGQITLKGNGNVGIGAMSSHNLTVKVPGNTDQNTANGLLLQTDSWLGGGYNTIRFGSVGKNAEAEISVLTNGGGGGQMEFRTSTDSQVGTLATRMTIAEAGNVGIGTTAPTQGLHVVGSARITGALYDSSNSAGSNGLLLTSTGVGTTWSSVSGALGGSVFLNGGNAFGGRATLGTTDNNALDIYTNSSAKLTVLANGNVGIGTTNPSTKLHVSGPNLTDVARFSNTSGYADIYGDASQNALRLYRGSTQIGGLMGQDGQLNLYAYSGMPLVFMANYTEYMRITTAGNVGVGTASPAGLFDVNGKLTVLSGGNVGIGTTSPLAKLDVAGTGWIRGSTANTGGLYVNSSGNVGVGTTAPGSKFTVSGGVAIGTTSTASTYLSKLAPDGGLLVEGNVGIGNTSPSYKLDVAGTGRYTGQLLAAGIPSGNGVSAGALYINPSSVSSAATVVWTDKNAWDAAASGAHVDLDSDSDYDYILNNGTAYKNTGSSSSPIWTAFASWNITTGCATPGGIDFTDLDGDGDTDALAGCVTNSKVLGFENTGSSSSPTWAVKTAWDLTPGMGSWGTTYDPTIVDLDNDGDKDLIVSGGTGGGWAYAYENTGSASSPTWSRKISWDPPTPGNHMGIDTGDLDADGDYDLIIGVHSQGPYYGYENTGSVSSPVWTAKSSWNLAWGVGNYAYPSLIDIDNDGDLDLYAEGNAYENTGAVGGNTNTLFGIAVNDDQKFRLNGQGSLEMDGVLSVGQAYNGALTALTVTQGGTGDIVNIFDGSTEVFTILDGGNVGIGNTNPLAKLDVAGTGWIRGSTASSGGLYVNSSGNVGIGTTAPGSKLSIAGLGSSTGTALVIDANGDVWKDSSSLRYKDEVQPLTADFEKVLELEPVSYKFKGTDTRTIGYIAEDLHDRGLTDLVVYDNEGKPDAIKYDRLSIYLLELVKDQEKRLDGFSVGMDVEKLASMEATLASLKSDMEVIKGNVYTASLSALLAQEGGNVLGASSSATLSDLIVSGDTNVNRLEVAGELISGLLKINGLNCEEEIIGSVASEGCAADISTISGPLVLQSEAQGPLSLMAGKVVVDTAGNIHTKAQITVKKVNIDTSEPDSASAGKATIEAGKSEIIITTSAVTADSLIQVTFAGDYAPATRYWIESQKPAESFTLKLDQAVQKNVDFSWMIIN